MARISDEDSINYLFLLMACTELSGIMLWYDWADCPAWNICQSVPLVTPPASQSDALLRPPRYRRHVLTADCIAAVQQCLVLSSCFLGWTRAVTLSYFRVFSNDLSKAGRVSCRFPCCTPCLTSRAAHNMPSAQCLVCFSDFAGWMFDVPTSPCCK